MGRGRLPPQHSARRAAMNRRPPYRLADAASGGTAQPPRIGRRRFCRDLAGLAAGGGWAGCTKRLDDDDRLEKVWGRIGIGNGRFQKPRAIAIDAEDRLYIVDMTARIQAFDRDGNFLRVWKTRDPA